MFHLTSRTAILMCLSSHPTRDFCSFVPGSYRSASLQLSSFHFHEALQATCCLLGAGGHAHAFLLILSSIWRHLELILSSKVIQKTQRETNNHSFLEAPALTINILYVNGRASAFYLKTATCWLPWRWLMPPRKTSNWIFDADVKTTLLK